MAGLKFVSAKVGVQFVMTSGRIRMLVLHVVNLVSLTMVRNKFIFSYYFACMVYPGLYTFAKSLRFKFLHALP